MAHIPSGCADHWPVAVRVQESVQICTASLEVDRFPASILEASGLVKLTSLEAEWGQMGPDLGPRMCDFGLRMCEVGPKMCEVWLRMCEAGLRMWNVGVKMCEARHLECVKSASECVRSGWECLRLTSESVIPARVSVSLKKIVPTTAGLDVVVQYLDSCTFILKFFKSGWSLSCFRLLPARPRVPLAQLTSPTSQLTAKKIVPTQNWISLLIWSISHDYSW